jgi:5,5'-dehydrodivanillate O-demethylase
VVEPPVVDGSPNRVEEARTVLTREVNERLTQTGPGTPGGNFLRRFWWPVAAAADLDSEPVMPVRILGENLTVFKDTRGNVGLIGDRCAHRAISLAYGIPQENGLRCAYHGWTYNTEGRVVDMPFEPACLPLKVKSYPTQVLGGLVWAYLGPADTLSLLPRWEAFAREDLDTRISFIPLPCNWVQCMDNSLDPVHFEHLHGHYGNYVLKLQGKPAEIDTTVVHRKIDFDVKENGLIYKRRLVTGEAEDSVGWTIGHPIVFPYMLGSATGGLGFQIRIPIDDTHTIQMNYNRARPKGEAPREFVTHTPLEYDAFGRVSRSGGPIGPQDWMAWVAQGAVSDRTREHLATSDKGIILYHNIILESIAAVERGDDPYGVIRDPAINEPWIEIPTAPEGSEHQNFHLQERQREMVRG